MKWLLSACDSHEPAIHKGGDGYVGMGVSPMVASDLRIFGRRKGQS